MSGPIAAVVVPCLNEEAHLAETAKSLGFGSRTNRNIVLAIVDNGSVDSTCAVAHRIRDESAPGSVLVASEPLRGYVPARARGIASVATELLARGYAPANVLIVQADADTRYCENYVEELLDAMDHDPSIALYTGVAEYPPDFTNQFAAYANACRAIDGRVLGGFASEMPLDVVRTDAVAAFRLCDYWAWGGYLREFDEWGDEIHAETTRLFMRGLAVGAQLRTVESAVAYPSQRRVVADPLLDLGTSGFPRSSRWLSSVYDGLGARRPTLAELMSRDFDRVWKTAEALRARHLVGLFGVLPIHVQRTLAESAEPLATNKLWPLASLLPHRGRCTLQDSPGKLVNDVLQLIDSHAVTIDDFLKASGLQPEPT